MSDLKQPGQRAYELWLRVAFGDQFSRYHDAWEDVDASWQRAWAAVEQSCAVPAEPEQAGKEQLYHALQKLADSWRSGSNCLRGEVARGIAFRQSEESKLSRAEVLDSCAEQIRRLLPAPPTKDPTNG